MDSFIYALVLEPALRELLPLSGIEAVPGEYRFLRRPALCDFPGGWGFAFGVGAHRRPLRQGADLDADHPVLLAVHLPGLCGGGRLQPGGVPVSCRRGDRRGMAAWAGVFVAEEWPESRRRQGAAWMHTGYYFGIFLAAIVNYVIGSRYGWRAVFAVGGTPALLVAFIRYGVREPKRWQERTKSLTPGRSLAAIFAPEYRQRTIVNAALLFISMVGLWAGSVYVPSSVRFLSGSEWRARPRRRPCCSRSGRFSTPGPARAGRAVRPPDHAGALLRVDVYSAFPSASGMSSI